MSIADLSVMRSILVFRALQLGDMLCAVPALRALRGAAPRARITLAGLPWAEQFAQRFPCYLDGFLAFPGDEALPEQAIQADRKDGFASSLRDLGPELAIQMHGDGSRTNAIVAGFGAPNCAGFFPSGGSPPVAWAGLPWPDHGPEPERLLKLTDCLGVARQGTQLEFPVQQTDLAELRASGLAEGIVSGSYFCVHPGARSRDKCWPAKCFAAAADHVALRWGLTPVLTGAANEAELAREVASQMRTPARVAAGPISVGAMAALMQGARLLICNDTGVSHIAAGLRLPSVVVFSKADIRRWAPADASLHRCLWDPAGVRIADVMAQSDSLMAGAAPPPAY
ncbi:LPS biosynthesis glycosyltransferase [Massilia sp. KIM]|uniref:glycosyltransferase family 9 protein n=1 Tax=Massilia sp. KIM TaxID=1955422 RepID=UPI00098F2B59|nr:glycosyltransferase family 9 protein [Massilia sp. KIM]OON62559.1 LPS biosynthesis glycosyltransferase [Massilia sp. KIM]